MKKIIFGVVILFSIVGCSVNVRMNEEAQNLESEESKVVVEENKIEQTEKAELAEQTEVLPSFSKEVVDVFGLKAVFVPVEKYYENGDKEYYYESFNLRFTVPAKYSQYYVLDTIDGMGDDSSVDFLTKEGFEFPPVAEAGANGVVISKMDVNKYKEFKNNIESEVSVWDSKEWKSVKIGEFDLSVYVYESFGSRKIYNYVLKNGDYYYGFKAPESEKDFIEAIIKSIKF